MMNNKKDMIDRMEECLEKLGVSSKVTAFLRDYIEEEISGNDFLSKLPEIDFTEKSNEELRDASAICNKLSDDNNHNVYVKFINLLFQMGGSTAGCIVWMNRGYFIGKEMDELIAMGVKDSKAAAMYTEAFVWNYYFLKWEHIKAIYQLCKMDCNILEEASSYCRSHGNNAKIIMSAVSLMVLTENKGTKFTKAEEEKLDDFIHCVLWAAANLTVPGAAKETLKLFKAFLEEDTDGAMELPEQLKQAASKGASSQYLIRILTGSSFLCYKASRKLISFMKITAYMDVQTTLSAIYEFVPHNIFNGISKDLDRMLMIPAVTYILWAASHNNNSYELNYNYRLMLEHKLKVSKSEYLEAVEKADIGSCIALLTLIRESGDVAAKKSIAGFAKTLQTKIILSVTNEYTVNGSAIHHYLSGVSSLNEFLPNVSNIIKERYFYEWYLKEMMGNYIALIGKDEFYERIVNFCALIKGQQVIIEKFFIYHTKTESYDQESINQIFEIFQRHQLPTAVQINFIEITVEGYSYNCNKTALKKQLAIPFEKLLEEQREDILENFYNISPYGRNMVLTALYHKDAGNISILLNQFNDTSKLVRENLVTILSQCEDQAEFILDKLKSKKQGERETAILIINSWKKEKYREILSTALETEKSKKIITLLQSCLNITSEELKQDMVTIEELVKYANKGNRKASMAWAFSSPFSPVAFQKKTENTEYASEDYMRAVLFCYSDMQVPGVNTEVHRLTGLLNEKDLELFSQELFDRWYEAGAEAKKKWVLYFSSIHGGADMVAKFVRCINEWPQKARGAIACEAVKALALNGTSIALMTVDGISRKFKYKQVKSAAADALAYAASQLSMTTEELSDKIVPNLGFDETMMRIFDYGGRKFKVYITPELELQVFDDSGKQQKSLPAPGKKDDPELSKAASNEFKQLKKQLKATVMTQKIRLELALSSNRIWTTEAWKALFVVNPVMHQFAISLVWGIYEDGYLKNTFRYMEDGTFNNEEEDEFDFPEVGEVGLVHPIELKEASLNAWKQQFEDYEIKQPFEQLNRKICKIKEEEKGIQYLDRFGGYVINGLSLSGKLIAGGWYRGDILDGGGYYTYFKEDKKLNIGVELEFSGLCVGGDNEDTTIYVARFYQPKLGSGGSHYYHDKKNNVYSLEQVPEKYFSETVYQLEKALSSSSEVEEGWRAHAFPKS